ncbi:MAG TPA: lytic transglycosylase domain-containing protein, partial [Pseudolabrys sp.]|nr:lytic transglycosylase domain-containing protein [Pseudolabrys sp.]
ESNLNPAAQAATSSAKGLYQFIDQTWLSTMKQAGAALGLSNYADAISKTPDGRYEVADPTMRSAIMKLRGDHTTSAMMAGALTRGNANQLSAAIGRQPTEGELYIAHFLGPDGAGKLIGAASSRPRASAATMFPQAAAANPSIFYDRSGNARSASAVYATLTGRFAAARAAAVAPDLRGTVGPTVAAAAAPDTAGITQALASASDSLPSVPDNRPLFQSMFSDRTRTAVASTVSSLWSTPKNGGANAPTSASAQPLNLFSDGGTDIRKLFGNS